MKKLVLILTSIIFLSATSFAQLGYYEFAHSNGNSCSSPLLNVDAQPSHGTFSSFSRSNVTCQNEEYVLNSKGWPTASSINTSYYVEFTVTAAAGYVLNLTSISFEQKRNNNGPQDARIAHNNSGNFTTDYNNFSPGTSQSNQTWNFTDFTTTAGGSVTFRVYAWDANNSSSGTFYIDAVSLYGTITAAATSPTVNAGSAISTCTGTSAITMSGATASGSYSAVAWSGGSGSGSWSGSGTNPATYQFTPSTASGSFTATLTATGSGSYVGTNPTSTRTISWGTTPTATAGSAITSCGGSSAINVTGASAGGSYSGVSWSYTPTTGTGSVTSGSTTLTPTFTPTSASGSGTLTLTVTGSGSCAGTNPTSSRTVTWSAGVVANAGPNVTRCTGTNMIGLPDATVTGSYSTIAWSYTPISGTATLTSYPAYPTYCSVQPSSASGSGTVTMTVTGSGACSSTTVTSSRTVTWAQAGTWQGTADNNWLNPANWCSLPDENTNVTIPSGTPFQPTISADGAVCNDLTINSGASVTVNAAGVLHIKGNLVNNGTAAHGTGKIMFDGNSNQAISGSNDFTNFELNKTASNLSITSGTQNISGIVTLTSGNLMTNGNWFILKSSAAGTAQIAGSGSGTIMGNITVQQYIPYSASYGNSTFNHFISSPVLNATISEYSDDFTVTLQNYSSGGGTFYYFDEENAGAAHGGSFGYSGLKAPSSISVMQGYAAKITATTTVDVTGIYQHGSSHIKNLTYTPGNGDGWNFVGNPYPCGIDWNAQNVWVKHNITNSFYVWNPQSSQYASYNGVVGVNGGTNYIAPMQGFFVVATDSSSQIGVGTGARVTAPSTFFKTSDLSELVRLKLTGNGYDDETVLYFDPNSSDQMDNYDAYKISNLDAQVPSISTVIGENHLSINATSSHVAETVIPVSITAVEGMYTIAVTELMGFNSGNPVYLKDGLTGDVIELNENTTYTFSASGHDENRFFIIFSSELATGVDGAAAKNVRFYNANEQVVVEAAGLSGNYFLSAYNSAGQVTMPEMMINLTGGRYAFDASGLAQGIYILKLQNGTEVYNGKIVIR